MTHQFQLKNGLKIILAESHKAPVISVQMWVRTGSADEPKGDEGISHFIEHLVFKGTNEFGVGEIARTVEGQGGELNAYTSFDQTVFYVTMASSELNTGLRVIREMMGFPLFDPIEVDNERGVVIEEIKRGQDSLGRRGSDLLFKTHFKGHPYGLPVIGYEKNIKRWSAAHIAKYFRNRYSPPNMFLVVTGDFKSLELKKTIQAEFGPIPTKKFIKTKAAKWRPAKKTQIQIESATFEQSMMYLAWNAPSTEHKDVPALDVLSLILGQGESSHLVQRLRVKKALVNSVGAGCYSPLQGGLFMISLAYQPQKLEVALAELQDEVLKFLSSAVTTEEIQKAVLNLESDDFLSQETVDGLSRKLGGSQFYFHNLNQAAKYSKALRELTPAKLQKIAKKYLATPPITLVAVTKGDSVSNTKKLLQKWNQDFAKKLKSLKSTKASTKKPKLMKPIKLVLGKAGSQIRDIKLSSGGRLILRPSTDTALISARVAFLGGARTETDGLLGTAELMSRVWSGGTEKYSEEELAKKLDGMAAGVSPLVGRNSIGLSVDMLAGFEDEAKDIFAEVLTKPLWFESVMEREKSLQLEQIRTRKDHPAQICMQQFNQSIFAPHPYGRDMLGTEDSLRAIRPNHLHDFWKKHLNRHNFTMVVTGNFKAQKWEQLAEDLLSQFPKGSEFQDLNKLSVLEKPKTIFEKSEKEQSHIVYGFRGLSLNDPDRHILSVIQSVLAGQGGRLFLELRDKNSLAYSVSPIRMEAIETGYFGGYIACSPEKVKKAIEMFDAEFEKICSQEVPAAELSRAQKYLVGQHDIGLQRKSALCNLLSFDHFYGNDFNESLNIASKYFEVTSADIKRVAQKLFQKPSVVSIVGKQLAS